MIYASKKLIETNPNGLRAFLAGWFETIRYMRDNRDKTIEIATKRTEASKWVATQAYDDTMPIFSLDGRFRPTALEVLGRSFVDLGLLPTAPDTGKLLTEEYLPK